jgi:hypothetical protein
LEEQELYDISPQEKSQGIRSGLLGGKHVGAMFWSAELPIQHRGRFCSR